MSSRGSQGGLSGMARAAALSVTTAVTEVSALLDLCMLNPGIIVPYLPFSSGAGAKMCGSGYVKLDWSCMNGVCGSLSRRRAQWGNGDPCAGDGWAGVTCDPAGQHVVVLDLRAFARSHYNVEFQEFFHPGSQKLIMPCDSL